MYITLFDVVVYDFFQRFFGHALPRPDDDAQIFCPMKVLMKIHNGFILMAFMVLKLQILKKFRGDGASMDWAIFGVFCGLTPPNMI